MALDPHPADPIDRYVDDIGKNLLMMPLADIEYNKLEVRQHIDAAVDALVSEGVEKSHAVDQVLIKFGSAKRIGKQIAEASPYAWTWKRGENDGPAWVERLNSTLLFVFLAIYIIVVAIDVKLQSRFSNVPYCLLLINIIYSRSMRISAAYGHDYDGMSRALTSRLSKANLSAKPSSLRLLQMGAIAYLVALDFQPPAKKPSKLLTVTISLVAAGCNLYLLTQHRFGFLVVVLLYVGFDVNRRIDRLIQRIASGSK